MNPQSANPLSATLVWIDAREAIVVRMRGDRTWTERVESEVPAHHRATGHVRHDPAVRHGGGSPHTAGEPHRLEHLTRFIADVATRLAPGDELLILGPGTVHERLKRYLSADDDLHGRQREIGSEASPPLTERQLIARLRRLLGIDPRRSSVGAYRWSRLSAHRPSGQAALPPRRVAPKLRRPSRHAPLD
jgi:hypothetical protein